MWWTGVYFDIDSSYIKIVIVVKPSVGRYHQYLFRYSRGPEFVLKVGTTTILLYTIYILYILGFCIQWTLYIYIYIYIVKPYYFFHQL